MKAWEPVLRKALVMLALIEDQGPKRPSAFVNRNGVPHVNYSGLELSSIEVGRSISQNVQMIAGNAVKEAKEVNFLSHEGAWFAHVGYPFAKGFFNVSLPSAQAMTNNHPSQMTSGIGSSTEAEDENLVTVFVVGCDVLPS